MEFTSQIACKCESRSSMASSQVSPEKTLACDVLLGFGEFSDSQRARISTFSTDCIPKSEFAESKDSEIFTM